MTSEARLRPLSMLASPVTVLALPQLRFGEPDVIRHDSERVPLEIYSMVGLVPLFAAAVVEPSTLAKLPVVMQMVGNVLNRREFLKSVLPAFVESGEDGTRLLAVVNRTQLAAILQRALDQARFLSQYCVRSLSRAMPHTRIHSRSGASAMMREQAAPSADEEGVRTGSEHASAVQEGKVA
jgi:hypothetical protein